MKNIFVIILNFNNKNDTVKCLESLLNIVETIKIIVVDNNSSDDSVEVIKKQFSQIKVIENKSNLGFAAGNNVGIRYALKNGAERVFILNNDTICGPSVDYLLNADEDIIGPVLKFERDNKIIYDLGGKINYWTGRTEHEQVDSVKKIYPTKPDYISGAAIIINTKVFRTIGLFNEDYFLYYEDADFCSRAKRMGFNIAIEPKTIIYHKLGSSTGRKSKMTLYNNLRSNLIFINKNLMWYRKPIGWIYWLLLASKVIFNYISQTRV